MLTGESWKFIENESGFMRILLGITGASGIIIAKRLSDELFKKEIEVVSIISKSAMKVASIECPGSTEQIGKNSVRTYNEDEIEAGPSSGSFGHDGMVIVPCTMKTLSAVANGYSSNLITRAADVCIKQQRKLVIVPRETPLSPIHLENMLKLSRLGVCMIPPVMAFYNRPEKVSDMVDFITGKVLEALGIGHKLYEKWK